MQKEVAERICARPGQMSILSVSAQLYYSCDLSIIVTKDKFTPPPKVDSQVVHLIRKKPEEIPGIDPKHFFRVVKAGFSARRKTLLNSLSGGLNSDKKNTSEILELAGYDVTAAENGKSGVDLALKQIPDLIVCDVMMPELDGYGVLHILSKNQKTAGIPFIFFG